MGSYTEIITWRFQCPHNDAVASLESFFNRYGEDGYDMFISSKEFPHIRIYGIHKTELLRAAHEVIDSDDCNRLLTVTVNDKLRRYTLEFENQHKKYRGPFMLIGSGLMGLTQEEENERV